MVAKKTEKAARVSKGGVARVCAGTALSEPFPGCSGDIAYRDSKGYLYCEEHGAFLKANGREGVVRLKRSKPVVPVGPPCPPPEPVAPMPAKYLAEKGLPFKGPDLFVSESEGTPCEERGCQGVRVWHPSKRGLTCGGHELQGWMGCSACSFFFLTERSQSAEAVTWRLSSSLRSVEAGSARIRIESSLSSDEVEELAARIVRLPELELKLEELARDSDARPESARERECSEMEGLLVDFLGVRKVRCSTIELLQEALSSAKDWSETLNKHRLEREALQQKCAQHEQTISNLIAERERDEALTGEALRQHDDVARGARFPWERAEKKR